MYCKYCGNQLNHDEDVCLNCGKMVADTPSKPKEENKAGTLSIIGFILSFYSPLAGFILSIIALNKYKMQKTKQLKGLAIAGLALSIARYVMALMRLFLMVFVIILELILSYSYAYMPYMM